MHGSSTYRRHRQGGLLIQGGCGKRVSAVRTLSLLGSLSWSRGVVAVWAILAWSSRFNPHHLPFGALITVLFRHPLCSLTFPHLFLARCAAELFRFDSSRSHCRDPSICALTLIYAIESETRNRRHGGTYQDEGSGPQSQLGRLTLKCTKSAKDPANDIDSSAG